MQSLSICDECDELLVAVSLDTERLPHPKPISGPAVWTSHENIFGIARIVRL
jgi:hypothetical protein